MLRMLYDTEDSDWDTILEVFGKEGREDSLNIALGEPAAAATGGVMRVARGVPHMTS
jgi:hypothetical protein